MTSCTAETSWVWWKRKRRQLLIADSSRREDGRTRGGTHLLRVLSALTLRVDQRLEFAISNSLPVLASSELENGDEHWMLVLRDSRGTVALIASGRSAINH